jgi:hypothetical protein
MVFLTKAETVSESCMNYTLQNNPNSDTRLLLLNHGKELKCNMKYCPDKDENNLHNEAFWYRVSQSYIIPGTIKQHINGNVKNIKDYLYNTWNYKTTYKRKCKKYKRLFI